MLKQASMNFDYNRTAESIFAASRQVWLAGLGAVAVSRDWAQHHAGDVFKGLVKQGGAIESRAIRVIGTRVETSMETAEALWNQARRTVLTTVGNVAETAAAALPKLNRPLARHATVSKTRKAAKRARPARKGARRAKRSSAKSK